MRSTLRRLLATVATTALLAGLLAQPLVQPAYAAAQDNTIDMALLSHNSHEDVFRTPFGAVPAGTPVTLRFQTAYADVQTVQLRVWDTAVNGETIYNATPAGRATNPAGQDVDLWEVTLSSSRPTQLWYRWIVKDGTAVAYYADDSRRDGGLGAATGNMVDNSYCVLVYDRNFSTPDWLKNATIYQIFPDRFRNGSTANDPRPGDLAFGMDPVELRTWTQNPDNPRRKDLPGYDGDGIWSNDFFGGDLAGVAAKLDYLQSLGVTVIYFNPIFDAGSNHRYDTSDYKNVDPYVGTNEEFRQLVAAAEARGMKVVLDGVFNHTGSDSIYMDRYHKWPADGAFESQSSPYYDWYTFTQWPSQYDAWWGYDSLPNLKENDAVKNFIYRDADSAARFWLNLGMAGWRLDVYPEVSQPFWREFRQAIKATKPDSVMIGEVWDNAARHFLGDELDSTMNYRFRTALLQFLAGGRGLDKGNPIPTIDAAAMDNLLQSIREDYPADVVYSLMNLLDSHDTNRVLDSLGYDLAAEQGGDAVKLAEAKARLKLMAALQFTYPGAPTVYYGDEVGVAGGDDPDDRRTYPWADLGGNPDTALLAYYQTLGQLRQANPVLRTGDLTTLYAMGNQYAYGRRLGDDAAITVLNADSASATVSLNVAGYLPDGARFTDKLSSGQAYTVAGGKLTVALGGVTAAVLVADAGQNLAPLAAPTGLNATGGTGRVTLTWNAVPGATGYVVYRSTVDGWYQPVGQTGDTTFADTTVANGQKYFYTVAAAGNGLRSVPVSVVPAVQIGWGNLQWPESIKYVLVAGVPTETIYGQVWVGGVTDRPGQGAGITAQVGYGPEGTAPETWTTWTNAAYNVDVGNNDEYKASLLPTATGRFHYTYRYSGDGTTWYYGRLNNGNLGLLEVVQSTDTVPPAAPTGLTAVTSQGKIQLSWTAPPDQDLFQYWVYRGTASGQYVADPIARVSTTAYSDEGLDTATTYYYVVKAVDTGLNVSPASNEVFGRPVAKQVAVTFQVQVPAYTPGDYPVYVAGSFPGQDWNPGGIHLTSAGNGLWTTTLSLTEGQIIQYKYARGSWDRVEKDAWGGELANRSFTVTYGTGGTQTLADTVARWRDLPMVVTGPATETVVVDPQATVTGNAYLGAGVTVNGLPATQNESGDFTATVPLNWHANLLTVKTSGQGELARTETRTVYRSAGAIGWANLQWPPTLATKVGIATENAYGQIWLGGVTDRPGQGEGIRAQLGFGPEGTDPSTWTTWTDATYNVDVGNNDEYRATLTPTAEGAYAYTYRYTSDGKTWYYGRLNDGGLGRLTVAPTGDTTPPAAPTGLTATAADGKVLLAWSAVADPDLQEYRVYRSTTSGQYGSDPIATVTAPSFTDANVTHGTTYYYVVKAVDASLNLSAASNEASALGQARMAAVTFRVQAPAYTPAGDTLYVVGGFPEANWVANGIALTHLGAGLWEKTLTLPEGARIEYKYTRGSWDLVEKDAWGNEISNRVLMVAEGTQADTVARWRDVPLVVTAPMDGTVTTDEKIVVTGNAYLQAGVTVNGMAAVQNDSGDFTTGVALSEGANTITVATSGAGELARTITLTVTRKPAIPTVLSPASGVTGIDKHGMQVTFSAPMDVTTLTEANLQVTREGKPGKVQIHALTYDAATSTLQIGFSLTYNETYRLELSGSIRDARGNALAPTTILFTTGPNPSGK